MRIVAMISSAILAALGAWWVYITGPVPTMPYIIGGTILVLGGIGYVGMVCSKEVDQPLYSSFISTLAQLSLALGVIALGTQLIDIVIASTVLIGMAVFAFMVFIYDLNQLISKSPKEGMQLSVWDHIIDSIIAVAVYSTIAWAGFWEPLSAMGYSPLLLGSYIIFIVTLALVLIQRLIVLPKVSKSLFDGLLFQVVIVGVLSSMASHPTFMAIPVLIGLVLFSGVVAMSCWLPGGNHLLEVTALPRGLKVGRVVTITMAAAYIPLTLGVMGADNIVRLTLISLTVTVLLFFRMQAVITIRDREMNQVNSLVNDLAFQAKHDLITGLYNLSGLKEVLKEKVEDQGCDVALVMIGLEGFDHVNDIHGYTAGDEALQVIGQRLQKELRPDDTAGITSGDEFVVILDHVDRPELGAHLAARLIDVIQEPCRLPGGEEVRIGACAGVALSARSGVDDLILNAELAVNQIRGGGRGAIRLADGSDTHKNLDGAFRDELITLFERDEVDCQFTPVIDMLTNTPVAMMVRPHWLRPGALRELAVHHQVNGPFFTWFFTRAFSFAKQAGSPIHLVLNQSHLASLELLPILDELLACYDLSGEMVTISIDSRTQVTHIPIEDFHARGITVGLDAFGATGVNLTDLAALPLDLLKIDPVLVRDMVTDRGYRVVVETIIKCCTIMGVPVVCRGIDTERIADVATALGATYGQGRHWGPPMMASDALEYWNTHAQPART